CMGSLKHYLGLILIIFALTIPKGSYSEQRNILLIRVASTINPTTKDFIKEAINKAERIKSEALIIELDTPGGLETSMRSIVKEILASEVPVVVYVSPKGARAGSAGVFITLASHIAVMAPGTNIGSAHPVSIGGGGEKDSVMSQKVTEDAKAFIRSIAELRGRNIGWAEEAVAKSVSITEKEALEKKVIDFISDNLKDLLKSIDGKTVKTSGGNKTINTKEAVIIEHKMSFRHKILDIVANPTIAYLLMILGIYALIYEFASPGGYVSGIVGIMLLILSLYALQILEVNFAGLIMVFIGVILIILEAFIVSYGLLAIGGIISLIIGFVMLFDIREIDLRNVIFILVPIIIILTLLFFFAFKSVRKVFNRKSPLGMEGLIGEEGIAKSEINEKGGWLLIQGELWSAYSDEIIPEGETAEVESYKGLKLKVRKKTNR
ncbi:MAG: nodulation protein NfeD, partial [Proteobacteria bacterium]|nr:nodulation protein NfeD [Pseudomonadota bacterium]